MSRNEKIDYMILFCGLMLVRRAKATLGEISEFVPLAGKARSLAETLHTKEALHACASEPAA